MRPDSTRPDYADELSGRAAERTRNRHDGRRVAWWLAAFAVALALTLWFGWPPQAGAASTESGAVGASAAAPVEKSQDRLEAVPVRIIDGDTFALGDETIRLADIDTPELDGKCDAERNLARIAGARLAALLSSHPWAIRRERTGKGEIRTDRYRRTLAVLLTPAPDGTLVSIGQILVAEGLAVPWEGRRHDWCGRVPG